MGAANGKALRLVDAEVELRRETKDFARWTLADVEELHRRFLKTFGFAVTASQFESLLLLKAPESVGIDEIFDALDANHDGRVDGLELLAALACVCRAPFEDKARFAFELFDFNRNGSLSAAELALLMKSVLVGMALLTGGNTRNGPSLYLRATSGGNGSMETMLMCLELAESAFTRSSSTTSLGFEAFIAWARSNREFMLQAERFRLIAEKAVGFEDALSLPDGSDDDSDLDAEGHDTWGSPHCHSNQHKAPGKRAELPPPWMAEPPSRGRYTANSKPIKDTGMPPPANLHLEWVYGTNGPSTRNSCRLLSSGEAVYFVGSYAVVYSSERHEQRYYRGHRRPIACMDVNTSADIVATGDDCDPSGQSGAEIHVWDSRSLQCLAVLRNFHSKGVTHVSFSAAASAQTTTLRQAQALSLGERGGAGGNSSAILSSSHMKKKPQETEALLASIGSDADSSMALWNWQREAIVASGRAHPAAGHSGKKTASGRRVLALALNEDGQEIVVCGAHFVMFHQVGGRFFKHKKPHWHGGGVDPPVRTVPVCLSVAYYGQQSAVVGTARGELLLFERHVLTRCVQAHDFQQSINVCLLSCHSMVLFSAGKDGQIKQWDSTLRPIGHALDLHTLLLASETQSSSLTTSQALEGDDFRVSSLAYDARRRHFLVATRSGNIIEIEDDDPPSASISAAATTATTTARPFRWHLVASGHSGQPTRCVATASATGGCFASCGVGDNCVKLWSLRRRALVQQMYLPGTGTSTSALAFTSDGERLVVGSDDGTLTLMRRVESAASSGVMAIETTMKNASSAVVTLRFGPANTGLPILAAARANGLIYLYRIETEDRTTFVRHNLLKPQEGDGVPARSLDFSVDGCFLRSQHGTSELRFWDLRQRAGTRVTSMTTLYHVEWNTHSTSLGWAVGGLPLSDTRDDAPCVTSSATRGLTLVVNGSGDVGLAQFPCPSLPAVTQDSSERCWLTRGVTQAHLAEMLPSFTSSGPVATGNFALRGSVAVTSCQHDRAICQWSVEKELSDVQPRPACVYDDTLRRRLRVLGIEDVYFGWGSTEVENEDSNVHNPRSGGRAAFQTVATRGVASELLQRSEVPDLSLTIAHVHGMNHHHTSLNQSIACLGGGTYIYGAGTSLVVRQLYSDGALQRVLPSGLRTSVSCIARHASEPVIAVGSRSDGRVVFLNTEKVSGSGPSISASFQQITTLLSSDVSDQKKTLIAVDFWNNTGSSSRGAQGDLIAVVWKDARSHVHTLAVYAWKRQLLVACASMTRLPVLFGVFAGCSPTSVRFVSGGIDHVTFWHVHPATGHISGQQGVFGRHALVQTALCATHVAPFVLTGMVDGSVVLWDNAVAAYTAQTWRSSTLPAGQGSSDNGVVALEHLPASRQVLGALRTGSLVVWQYSNAHSDGCKSPSSRGGRIQASTFLQLIREFPMLSAAGVEPASAFSPLFNVAATGDMTSTGAEHGLCVRGMHLMDDDAVVAITLSSGRVLCVERESILDSALGSEVSSLAAAGLRDKIRVLVDSSSAVNDVALHPRDLRWASASADGRVCVWNLHTNLLAQQQVMPSAPCALSWSATGEHLAVSVSSGIVHILDGATLLPLLEFVCGDAESSSSGGQARRSGLPKWCSVVKYSPVGSSSASTDTAGGRNWLALACRDYNVYVYRCESSRTDDGESGSSVYTLQHTFGGHTAPIEALDFSIDGEWLQSATGSTDAQILRWALRDHVDDTAPRGITAAWEVLDDAWASWTPTFSGPAAGLADCYGVSRVTSLSRIHGQDDSESGLELESAESKWQSPLPLMLVGLNDGRMLVAWYPLPCGGAGVSANEDPRTSRTPAALAKEYPRSFPRDSTVRRVGFSFANAFVVALARNASGDTQVLVWKTDYDEELRLRQRHAAKSSVLLPKEASPVSYVSPADLTLFAPTWASKSASESTSKALPRVTADRDLHSYSDDEELHLEFIYGLSPSATGTGNVFYADDAWEIVYAAGTCGVVYNTKTHTQLLNRRTTPTHRCAISAMAVHPKGDLVASGECIVTASGYASDRATANAPFIVIWDANSGSTIARVPTTHRNGVLLLEFSPDGHQLASIGMEPEHMVAVYVLTGGNHSANSSKSEGGRLCVTLVARLKTSSRHVWGLSLGDDGELATCGDRHIRFWQNQGSNEGETQAGCMKSGLLSSHKDCNPRAALLQVVHLPGRARVVASSQADGSLYLWKDRVCVTVQRHAHGSTPIPALAVDRKQPLLYSAGSDGRVCAWNTQLELMCVVADIAQLDADLPATTDHIPLMSTELQSLAVRESHILVSTAGGEVVELAPHSSSSIREGQILSGSDWRLQVHVRSHARGQLCGLAVHPCKRAQFATAGDDGSVRLWDAATRSLLAVYRLDSDVLGAPGGSSEFRALAFSPDGKHIAVGATDGMIRVLTSALDAVVTQWSSMHGGSLEPGSSHAVLTIQYSADGKLMAFGSQDGTVHVHNASNYRKLAMLRSDPQTGVTAIRLEFTQDRSVLRVHSRLGDRQQLRHWDLGTWKQVPTVQDEGDDTSLDLRTSPAASGGHVTRVASYVVTKNELFQLSAGGADRVVCQFRCRRAGAGRAGSSDHLAAPSV